VSHVVPRRALVLAAHPDDGDFRCAGTVAGWVEAGCEATMVVVTDGSKGSHDLALDDAEVAARRRQEQRAACATIGYHDVTFLDEVDGLLSVTEELLEAVVVLLRRVRPDVVLSYDSWAPYQLHPDHTEVGRLAFLGCIRAREPRFYRHFADAGLGPWSVRQLWLFGTPQPDEVVDIADHMDQKLAALLCHETQYPTEMGFELGDDAGMAAFCDRMRAMAARIGASAGVALGEDFKVVHLAS